MGVQKFRTFEDAEKAAQTIRSRREADIVCLSQGTLWEFHPDQAFYRRSPTATTTITATHLPPSFRKYFWDCCFEDLSMERHDLFIAARILNFGDWKAVSWLNAHGGRSLIRKTVKNRRDLSAKTINFWNVMLHG